MAFCTVDRVNRGFQRRRPNLAWVANFTYVSTRTGWVYVAFLFDVQSRAIIGWTAAGSKSGPGIQAPEYGDLAT